LNEATGEWAVAYQSGMVRFFSSGGALLGSDTVDLSSLVGVGGGIGPYTNPRPCDVLVTGSFSPAGYLSTVGDPRVTPPATWDVPSQSYRLPFQYVAATYGPGATPPVINTLVVNAAAPFTLAKWQWDDDGHGTLSYPESVGLLGDGSAVMLAETHTVGAATVNWVLPLGSLGVAQSVHTRNADHNPVVLLNNELVILERKYVTERLPGIDPYLYLYNTIITPDNEVGSVVDTFTITGLPGGALLSDLDQAFDNSAPRADNDTFYVLDSVGGGVYKLTPEPATLGLLAAGAVLALRRRRTA
jgi:hypothetical protein